MKRHTLSIVLLACGFLAATGAPALAQQLPPEQVALPLPAAAADTTKPADWFAGNFDFLLLGHEKVASSKFEEYRTVPNGPSMPFLNFAGAKGDNRYSFFAKNVSQKDQRYSGRANAGWFGVVFDYNSIPHNMGNDAKTIHTETAPGVWSMNATARKALGDAVDAVATTARIYPFYLELLGPTIAAAEHSTLAALRQRSDVAVNLGKASPFDVTFTYNRDVKTGYRGASAGDILGVVTSSVDVLEPLDEVTQDFGVRWMWNGAKGDVHAALNRNLYVDNITSLVVDNPFRASDLAYTSTAVPGGPAQARFSTAPDNEAIRGAFGGQLKLAKMTRLTADIALGQWTQNAAFLPYTINSAILTPAGLPANSVSSLQRQSLDGKVDTASYNFTFVTRPAKPLTLRAKYRNYSYKDNSSRYVSIGSTSGSPDRSWTAAGTPTEDEPYGYATANRTDSSIGHFDAIAAYDIGGLTVEGSYRNIKTSWVGRVGTSGTDGDENGYKFAAVMHGNDWVDFRGHVDRAKRTVSGIEAGSVAALQGVMADHAERIRTNVGLDVDISPMDTTSFTFGYARRRDDYPNRPLKVAIDPETKSGLLEASYDMYSVDYDLTAGITEFSAFYTYEKIAETNRWVTLTSGAVNNLLTYAPYDKGHTFGVNAVFNIVPEKWALTLFAQHQKVDGFLDITARETGSFYTPGRTTLIPAGQGGAADIADYDDMRQTTGVVDLRYNFAKAWRWSLGYAYDKFTTADAFSDGTTIFPQAVLFFLKQNDGNYSTNVAYTRLSYRF